MTSPRDAGRWGERRTPPQTPHREGATRAGRDAGPCLFPVRSTKKSVQLSVPMFSVACTVPPMNHDLFVLRALARLSRKGKAVDCESLAIRARESVKDVQTS